VTRPLLTPEGVNWGPAGIVWQQEHKNGTVVFRIETFKGKVTVWVQPGGHVIIHPSNDEIILKGVKTDAKALPVDLDAAASPAGGDGDR
jgi:hypothetical protein